MNETHDLIVRARAALDRIEATGEDLGGNDEHLLILLEAWKIVEQRQSVHKQGWKLAGWRGVLTDVMRKTYRLWTKFWTASGDVSIISDDDAVDLINYTGFFIAAKRAGNEKGIWPW